MADKSSLKKLLILATFGRDLLSKKLSLHARYGGEECFLHGTGGIRRRDHFLVIAATARPVTSNYTANQPERAVKPGKHVGRYQIVSNLALCLPIEAREASTCVHIGQKLLT